MSRFGRAVAVLVVLAWAPAAWGREQWSPEQAQAWAKRTPWLVGCNFIPSTAINQLEMWQAETFDPSTIDRELGWAEGLGFNSVRVFLHDIPWRQAPEGFLKRVDQFLGIAARHKIGVMLVLMDSVWDPNPKAGPQRAPRPHLHNSGWVQSPGAEILKDPARHGELEGYVKGVIGRFKDDPRVQVWDLINEPDNPNTSSYGKLEPPNKPELSLVFMRKVVDWARAAGPSQPLTLGVWRGEYDPRRASAVNRFQLEQSDVVTFHSYDPLTLKEHVATLRGYDRPLLCTEYMARPRGSTFDPVLGYLKAQGIGAYNWGFVDGKSQTVYPWETWLRPGDAEPRVWFHDIFRADGSPFDRAEVEYIRRVTGAGAR